MEKLSSILPSNNRITTVDLAAARPVRSGVDGFGVATANHERRPTLAASDILNISKPAQELSGTHSDSERVPMKSVIKQTENQYFANRKAEIDSRDQARFEAHEAAHAFAPEEKMHIADDLVNVPMIKPSTHAAPASIGVVVQAASNDGMFPRAVDRVQSRAMSEPGSRLSINA